MIERALQLGEAFLGKLCDCFLGVTLLGDVRSAHSILRIVILATLISCSLVRTPSNADAGNRLVHNEAAASMQTADSYGNITVHYGALTVANKSKMVIENCQFNQTGIVTIEDEAEVIIRNALYFSIWNSSERIDSPHEHFILRDHAKLTILNSTLKFTSAPSLYIGVLYDEIACYNQSVVNITESTIPYFDPYAGFMPSDNVNYWGNYVFGYDNSTIFLDSVVLSIFQNTGDSYIKSGVHLENQSHAKIWNSTVESLEINYLANPIANSRCNAEIAGSNLSSLEVYNDAELQISNSSISEAETYGPDTEIHLTNTTIDLIWGNGAKLWLHNSTIRRLEIPHETIWIVWDLPLLGQVPIPYDWAPLIIPVVVTTIAFTVIVILAAVLILISRKKGKSKNRTRQKINQHILER